MVNVLKQNGHPVSLKGISFICPVLPVNFANELLAKLYSCGTSADHTAQSRSKLR